MKGVRFAKRAFTTFWHPHVRTLNSIRNPEENCRLDRLNNVMVMQSDMFSYRPAWSRRTSAKSSEHATILGQKSGDGAFALVCRQAGPNFAQQPLHIDRLGIEIGTSDLDALVAIAGQRVGRQRNDWNC